MSRARRRASAGAGQVGKEESHEPTCSPHHLRDRDSRARRFRVLLFRPSATNGNVVRIGVLKHESSLPIYVADELGLFESRDVHVALVEVPPGDHMPALLSGRVDILSPTSFTVLFGVMHQHPDAVYAVFPGAEVLNGPIVYGFDQPALAVALASGDYRLLEANPRARYIGSPYWSGAGAVTREGWSQHRDQIIRLLAGIDDALARIEADPDAAHRILARRLGIDESVASQMGGYYFPKRSDAVPMDGIRATVDALVSAGLLPTPIDLNNFFPPGLYGR